MSQNMFQEYNICFTTTTIDKNEDATVISSTRGILPEVQKNLVERRRQIKDAIKRLRSNESSNFASLEIRQLALKLTANSMYGCLGYGNSRFFARPLAKLITQKGRELLEVVLLYFLYLYLFSATSKFILQTSLVLYNKIDLNFLYNLSSLVIIDA